MRDYKTTGCFYRYWKGKPSKIRGFIYSLLGFKYQDFSDNNAFYFSEKDKDYFKSLAQKPSETEGE